MPSDSCNSTMATATGLILLLFDVASAREVPFTIPLYTQCVLHGLSMAFLCVPFTTKSIDLVVSMFIVATLITKVLFKQMLNRSAA